MDREKYFMIFLNISIEFIFKVDPAILTHRNDYEYELK